MSPTFTAQEAAFPVTFGPDPWVYAAFSGVIAVTEEGVELTAKRPLLHWRLDPAVSTTIAQARLATVAPVMLFFMIAPVLLKDVALLLFFGFAILLLAFLSAFGVYVRPWRLAFPKTAVTAVAREGRAITLLAPGALAPCTGVRLIADSREDALRLVEALTRPGRTLPRMKCTGGELRPPRKAVWHDDFATGDGLLRVTPDTLSLSWEIPAPYWQELAVLWCVTMLPFMVYFAAVEMGQFPDREMWGRGAALAGTLTALFLAAPALLTFFTKRARRTGAMELSRADVDRVGEHFVLPFDPRRYLICVPRRAGEADALEAALFTPGEAGGAAEFPVRFDGNSARYDGPFFGRGSLLVEGDEVTLTGRRNDRVLLDAPLRFMLVALYLGLVGAAYLLYPLVFAPQVGNDMKGLLVLILPILLVLLPMTIVLPLLPVVLPPRPCTLSRREIRDLRRQGRQVTFTAPEGGERYCFHLRSAEEAASAVQALGG